MEPCPQCGEITHITSSTSYGSTFERRCRNCRTTWLVKDEYPAPAA